MRGESPPSCAPKRPLSRRHSRSALAWLPNAPSCTPYALSLAAAVALRSRAGRCLGPFAARVPGEELPVRIDGGHAPRVRPVALLLELREALAAPRGELAVGMLLDESPVGLARVGGFGRAPVLLLPAAACHQG